MPLFKPTHSTDVSPEDAVLIVHRFLQRCEAWARDLEIPKTINQLETEPSASSAARLHQWTSYLEFTRHTLQELEDGTLDRWFLADHSPDE